MFLRMLRLSVVSLFLFGSFASPADADVGPAPSCPTGQTSAYYEGRYCAPTPCTDDDSCSGRAECAERGLCVQPRTEDDPDAPPMALGSCDDDTDCVAPAHCERARFCGPGDDGCRVSAKDSPAVALVLLGLVLHLVRVRRAR